MSHVWTYRLVQISTLGNTNFHIRKKSQEMPKGSVVQLSRRKLFLSLHLHISPRNKPRPSWSTARASPELVLSHPAHLPNSAPAVSRPAQRSSVPPQLIPEASAPHWWRREECLSPPLTHFIFRHLQLQSRDLLLQYSQMRHQFHINSPRLCCNTN